MKEGWAKYALEIDDVIQRIYEGTSPEESAEIANKQFLKFNAQ
jgi:hypothetical protein